MGVISPDKLDMIDIEEIAAFIVGKSDDYEDTSELEDLLIDKYNIDLDNFSELMGKIWPLLGLGISPLTGSVYIGLSDNLNNAWIAKREFTPQFISTILNWFLSTKEDIKYLETPGHGFERVITGEDGTPQYVITIKKANASNANIAKTARSKSKAKLK